MHFALQRCLQDGNTLEVVVCLEPLMMRDACSCSVCLPPLRPSFKTSAAAEERVFAQLVKPEVVSPEAGVTSPRCALAMSASFICRNSRYSLALRSLSAEEPADIC